MYQHCYLRTVVSGWKSSLQEHARTIKDLKGQHLETNLIVVSLMALVSKCSWSCYKVELCLPLSLANSQVLKSR